MNISSVLSAIKIGRTISKAVIASGNSSRLSSGARYLAGLTIGVLLMLLVMSQEAKNEPVSNDQLLFHTLESYRQMIARDDALLDLFMDGSWDRACGYRIVPGIMLADGSIRSSIVQECKED